MRRAAGLAVLLALVVAAPAAAQAPVYLDFESEFDRGINSVYSERGDVTFSDGESCGLVFGPGGNFGPNFLSSPCDPIRITFRDLQAQVSLYGQLGFVSLSRGVSSFTVTAFGDTLQPPPIDTVNQPNNGVTWDPVTVRTPDGQPGIRQVQIEWSSSEMHVDDLGFSPFLHPDTAITGGPANPTTSTDATFTFGAGDQPRLTFFCKLDDLPSEACTSPKSYSGLALGSHTFQAWARDQWTNVEETRATRTWTINAPPPPPADRDLDGVLDATDNCPDTANAGQGDADRDLIGDACEIFESGNAAIEAGRKVTVQVLSGDVFIKLPPGASASAFTTGLRAPFQESGFLPLKGVAAVPVGSVVDARRGSLALTAAIDSRRAGHRRQLRRRAQFAAGIFAIRQKRAARRRPNRRRPPNIVLASAPGAEAPCARRAAPVRVRALTTTAKGVFRTVGGASTTTPLKGNPTFITTDRCDGTVTEVGRGRVAVASNRTGRRRTVRAGRAYIVKARLFAARKGRRSP